MSGIIPEVLINDKSGMRNTYLQYNFKLVLILLMNNLYYTIIQLY